MNNLFSRAVPEGNLPEGEHSPCYLSRLLGGPGSKPTAEPLVTPAAQTRRQERWPGSCTSYTEHYQMSSSLVTRISRAAWLTAVPLKPGCTESLQARLRHEAGSALVGGQVGGPLTCSASLIIVNSVSRNTMGCPRSVLLCVSHR